MLTYVLCKMIYFQAHRDAFIQNVPVSRNLTGRNATRHHVRAMKLTGVIQLAMTFRRPAFVLSVKARLNLLIWLAAIQASSLMLLSRQYVYFVRASSVDNPLLLTELQLF